MKQTTRIGVCVLALLASGVAARAQLEPRASVKDYLTACRLQDGAIGADYLRRSLPTPQGIRFIPGMLIFEIGVFPERGKAIALGSSDFQLNWKKADLPLLPVHPQYVVASLLRPEYSQGDRSTTVSVGRPNQRTGGFEGVTIGGPPRFPRFPDDPRRDGPPLPRAPAEPRVTPKPPQADERPDRILSIHALSADPVDHPSGGYVYFAYKGKLKKLKGLVLTIRDGEDKCNLRMRD